MTGKRSQMWPRQGWDWQRLGAASCRCWGSLAGREGGGAKDPVGHGEGREPPGPAVRGQQRAALGLREKLPGVGSWDAFGVGSLEEPDL